MTGVPASPRPPVTTLAVPCPECKRPAGVPCITLDTHQPSKLSHRARWKAAEQATT